MIARFHAAAMLCVVALLAGCTTYSAPTLAVSNVRIADESPSGLVLEFSLDASNRNEIELPLREVRYTLSLDGQEVFRGVRSPEATLRRVGTQTIKIPAVIPLGDGQTRPTGTRRFAIDGSLAYTTPGQLAQVLFDIKVRRPTVSFHTEGEVDLSTPVTPAPAGSGPPG